QSQLQMQLSQLRMQADETVAGFFARTMLLRDELTSAGCPPTDHSLMLAVLNAMPSEFKIAIQLLRYQLTVGQKMAVYLRFDWCRYHFDRLTVPFMNGAVADAGSKRCDWYH
ncbi:hypothetical protein, partial [Bosea sp. (in: a-proteobacteria)]|uniref:hypothetical protein n=1 Tax=Bosea sp. (in: a-proteobacteria) TaxID=1871050 RepID=UPI004034A257